MTTLDDNPNQLDLNLPGLGPDTIFALAGADFIRTATLGSSLIFGDADNDTLLSLGPNDTLYGGDDEDSIRSQRSPALLFGDEGADTVIAEDRATVYGGDDEDYLQGTVEANLLFGNEGNDTMQGGAQRRDSLYGGKGNDAIGFFIAGGGSNIPGFTLGGGLAGNEGSNFLRGDLGDDSVFGVNQRDSLYGGKGSDTLYAVGESTYVSGDDDNDTLISNNFNQTSAFTGTTVTIVGQEKVTLLGGAGNDSLYGSIGPFGGGRSFYEGGDGNDTIRSYAAQDSLSGGSGNDFLASSTSTGLSSQGAFVQVLGYGGRNLLDGGTGDDTISAGFSTDTMIGADGNDSLTGIFTRGSGENGNDTIDARFTGTSVSGIIPLEGGLGEDLLYGTTLTGARNALNGGAGNDTLVFGTTGDSLVGDVAGNDTIYYATTVNFTGSTVNFITDTLGNNYIIGGNGTDAITTGSGNDILIGGPNSGGTPLIGGRSDTVDGNDVLDAGAGNDQLYGSFGNDTLIGGDGNDSLFGGPGLDILAGGAGNDSFYFLNSNESTGTGSDGIFDFIVGQDKLVFRATSFNLQPPGSGSSRTPSDPELEVVSSLSALPDTPGTARLVYVQSSGELYFDDLGQDDRTLILNLNSINNDPSQGRSPLRESDIILI